jgi:hypothetical protein
MKEPSAIELILNTPKLKPLLDQLKAMKIKEEDKIVERWIRKRQEEEKQELPTK